jgi:cell division protein FtsI/penicillin-binding protein 2
VNPHILVRVGRKTGTAETYMKFEYGADARAKREQMESYLPEYVWLVVDVRQF